ncbi:MAG: fibrobacter succinogenes major paralogous domain-containing protein [Alistipes sp.]|nr:fibrobacter succinogenes major paralogous domain-containing protein [Alistipes sp.]
MTNTSTNGYYWSASQSATNAIYSSNLNINSSNVNPANQNQRANGFSVRCVAAFHKQVCGITPALIFSIVLIFTEKERRHPAVTRSPYGHARTERGIEIQRPTGRSALRADGTGSYADVPLFGRAPTGLKSGRASIPAAARNFAGWRAYNTGAMANTSTNGYYWSASQAASAEVRSSNLNINSGNVNPANNNVRANGLSVRCVAAFYHDSTAVASPLTYVLTVLASSAMVYSRITARSPYRHVCTERGLKIQRSTGPASVMGTRYRY